MIKWRKYDDEKPEHDQKVLIRCIHQDNCDFVFIVGCYVSDPKYVSAHTGPYFYMNESCCDSTHYSEETKYWIPLEELHETLPKDEK